jgi:cysteinylglycine-S-conjugate dipeptidase
MTSHSTHAAPVGEALYPLWFETARDFIRMETNSQDPSKTPVIEQCANAAGDWLLARGFEVTRVPTAAGRPALLATSIRHPNARTVIIYGHLDVQPQGDDSLWKVPPFDLTEQVGPEGDVRLYGRGSADMKGCVFAALVAAIAARDAGAKVNVAALLETGEEIGSPDFPEILDRTAPAIAKLPDPFLLVPDLGTDHRYCTISMSTRGLVRMRVKLTTMRDGFGNPKTAHSGLASSLPANALMRLTHAVGSLWDKTGKLVAGGLDVPAAPLPEALAAKLVTLADPATFGAAIGSVEPLGISAREVVARIMELPSAEICSIASSNPPHAVSTMVPGHAECVLNCRVPFGLSHEKLTAAVVAHLKSVEPAIDVEVIEASDAVELISADDPLAQTLESAYRAAFGPLTRDVVYDRGGGTITALKMYREAFPSHPIVPVAVCEDDSAIHAPNEFVRKDRVVYTMETIHRFLFAI